MNNPTDVIFTGTARGWQTAGTDTAALGVALAAPEIPAEHKADERKSSLVFQMLWCSKWCLTKMLWKAILEMPDPALKRGWSSQIPFSWQIQRELGIPSTAAAKFTSWCLSSSSQESPTHRNQHLAGWTDSFLVKLMLQPYFVVILFEISKDQKHKLWKSIFFTQEVKKQPEMIYRNISSEEAAKQQAKRKNSKIKHRQHADKEANETVLKGNRSQGEQEVTHSTFSRCSHSLLIYSCKTKYLWCWEH